MSSASFGKRQREKERREKAAAKAARRAERQTGPAEDTQPAQPLPQIDEAVLLADLASVHERFASGEIDFETFTVAKQEITERLLVD